MNKLDELDRLFEKTNRYSVIKRKNKIIVKEIYIEYIITIDNELKNIKCQCCKSEQNVLCSHLLFLFVRYYDIDIKHLIYYSKIKHVIYETIINNKRNELNEILYNYIKNEILNIDCGFCLESIEKYEHIIYPCCKNMIHRKCIIKLNSIGKNDCIFCRNKFD